MGSLLIGCDPVSSRTGINPVFNYIAGVWSEIGADRELVFTSTVSYSTQDNWYYVFRLYEYDEWTDEVVYTGVYYLKGLILYMEYASKTNSNGVTIPFSASEAWFYEVVALQTLKLRPVLEGVAKDDLPVFEFERIF
jgi:hypothetical protein